MKPIYECEWCSFRGTAENVEYHERHCEYNPKNIEIKKKLEWIAEHCPHRSECYDEYYFFLGCKKDGHTGHLALECEPTSDCLQYCEGEDVWEKF